MGNFILQWTLSVIQGLLALLHACIACSLKPSIDWIAASDLEDDTAQSAPEAYAAAWKSLRNAECVLVPGGFGDRGVSGMILAAKYARENNVPYLGICLGMQISVIEYARSVLGLEKANSNEFDDETPDPVVIFMPEVNPDVIGVLEEAGLKFVGKDETGKRMEVLELPSHPFYIGVQFHPEFKSRPGKPSALFLGLILAARGKLEAYLTRHQNGS
ncbi:CTP synthase [Gossypium australe]|uniref:CTP synthase (glutamine hydrolyzing) n=1 Tax=Gossypium australe TaxID=47621 RepID=A0A5B6VRA6_9ROSI|nr:CTP synthase [Gossypium australe]